MHSLIHSFFMIHAAGVLPHCHLSLAACTEKTLANAGVRYTMLKSVLVAQIFAHPAAAALSPFELHCRMTVFPSRRIVTTMLYTLSRHIPLAAALGHADHRSLIPAA
jgi:hypothetical protein